jgi:hypothetical protein
VVLVDAELAGFAQRSLAKFQGLESRFAGPKGGGRPSRAAGTAVVMHDHLCGQSVHAPRPT